MLPVHFNGHFPGGPGLADTRAVSTLTLLELMVTAEVSVVGTGGSGGSMNRGPELLGLRVVGP